MTHVYVAYAAGLARTKVGISNDPAARIRSFEWALGSAVDWLFSTPSIDRAREVERLAHSKLGESCSGREWFGVCPETAIKAVCDAANEVAPETTRRKEPRVIIATRAPSSMKAELQKYAAKEGRSLNSYIARALEWYVRSAGK